MEYFTSEKLTDSITMITDLTYVHMFLIEGKDKAVLVDTGTGIGNIKEYVDELTNLPLTVILTHGHLDHTGGAVTFDKVYLNEKDKKTIDEKSFHEAQKSYVKGIMKDYFNTFTDKDLARGAISEILPLNNGDVFELGGISIEAIAVPGHTQGMMCILIPEERIIIFGDGCCHYTLLCTEESTTVAEFKNSLLKLKKHEDRYDTVFTSHGREYNAGKDILDNVLELCDAIMNGEADDEEFHFMGTTACLARRYRDDGLNREGKMGNIVYSKDRI